MRELDALGLVLVFFCLIVFLVWALSLKRKIRLLESFRRDFVANISHEFRTPLTVIKGYTETLLTTPLMERKTEQSFLGAIQDHTDRLIRMVENLLELARFETIGVRGSPSFIRLSHFFEILHQKFQHRLEVQKIDWEVSLTPPLENIETDPDLLETIFINLVDNAIKYTEGPGKITLRAEREKNQIRFSVEDHGIGLIQEEQKRIFERFYRVNKGRNRNQGGAGLGLSIVKHLVQAQGGEVGVTSEIGKGSQFFFTIPLQRGALST